MALAKTRKIAATAVTEWINDNCLRLGAAISYYTVFSLGPLLILSISLAGLLFGEEAARGQLSVQMGQLIGDQGAKAIETMIASARSPTSGIIGTIVGLAAMFFGAMGVFGELKSALNAIWKQEAHPTPGIRGFLFEKLLSFAMVLSIGFLLLVSLVVTTVLATVTQYFQTLLPMPPQAINLLSNLISFLLVSLLFALIFKVLPDIDLEWKDVLVGAGITSLLFTIGKFLIGLYLGRSAISSTYGASASLVIVMLWTYYSSLILFFGAEWTKAYAYHSGSLKGKKPRTALAVEAAKEKR